MATYPFKILIEPYGPTLFYSLVERIGGGGELGFVDPGGTVHEIPYEHLLALGDGWHDVQLDYQVRDVVGVKPVPTPDEAALLLVRFHRFAKRADCPLPGALHCSAIHAFNDRTKHLLLQWLDEAEIQELAAYARELSASPEVRAREGFSIWSDGHHAPFPEESLLALRRHFVDPDAT